jgi:hypothetical protein
MSKSVARWVAPPNWPAPPPGFTPETGWQPDPSWGPPPDGWQFWQVSTGSEVAEAEASPPGKLQRWRAERAERARDRQLQTWQSDEQSIQEMLSVARTFYGLAAAPGFILKRTEAAYSIITDVALIEPRRAPGQYKGSYSGYSFRITQGVRYHVGGSRGRYVPGPESPTIIDRGDACITDQRVLFRGPKQSREWQFAKMIGYTPSADRSWTALQVSNRQKVSGIAYGTAVADLFEFRFHVALATFQGQRDELIANLEREQQAHSSARP